MLYVDIPTIYDLRALETVRVDACVSIFTPTTPITQDVKKSRIIFGNSVKTALRQLEQAGTDKRRLASLKAHLDDLAADDEFWRFQAYSLAVFATPESVRTYRLANRLHEIVEVSDRFHLNPLTRAIAFPQTAYVLAVSENAVRLVEIAADLPAVTVRVPDLPTDAASAVGVATINDPTQDGRRVHGAEGQKIRLAQYIRKIDAALRPILANSNMPVILAATQPVESLFRSVSSVAVLPQSIVGSHDRTSEADLAAAARPVLDAHYARQLEEFRALFELRAGQSRTTTDISDAARAATFGNIAALLVDIDSVVDGSIDEETGAVTFDNSADATNYSVVDEIVGRALRTGAQVIGVRKDDIPDQKPLAAILRSPL